MFAISDTQICEKRNIFLIVSVSLIVNHTVAIHFARVYVFVCQ